MINMMVRFSIILSLSSLASGQLQIPPGGCSVCGEGKEVTSPDAVFTFPGQPEARCDLLQDAGLNGIIPINECSFLPPYISEACQCAESARQTTSAPTPAPTSAPTSAPTLAPKTSKPTLEPVSLPLFVIPTASPTAQQPILPELSPVSLNECPDISTGCAICGDGFVVSNFDAVFSNPDLAVPDEMCFSLQLKGINGVLSQSYCSTLPDLIFDLCGCVPCGLTLAPTTPPTELPTPIPTTPSPTSSPTPDPTFAPTADPTLAPTPAPTTPPPTPAPTLAPTVEQIPCAEISSDGCSVCGSGLCVGNRDATFKFPGQADISCGDLEDEGSKGNIDSIQCQVFPAFATEQCECGTTRPAPAVPTPPTLAPTEPRITIAPTAQDFGCSICGDGFEVKYPDAIFKFPGRTDEFPCSVVQEAGYTGLIRNGQCERLPDIIANSTCECQPLATSAPISDPPPPTSAPVKPAPLTPAPVITEQPYVDLCPAVPPNGCSICGGIECVGNPTAIWTYQDQPDISCGDLEADGLNGLLNPAYCAFLPGFISEICECGSREGTLSPTKQPTNLPTPSPTPSASPPVAPTGAPVTPAPNAVGNLDIPHTLIDAEFFTTLIEALNATGLIETLSEQNGDDIFTIFAPSDDAFINVDVNLECMFRDENIEALNAILEFHVVPGLIVSTNFVDGQSFTTLNGDTVTITVDDDGEVKVENAEINIDLMPGVNASNGIVYLVDDALIPSGDVVATTINRCQMLDTNQSLVAATFFDEFLEALDAIDVDLSEPNGPYTVFALGSDTIDALPDFPVGCLSRDEFSPVLKQILGYHIVEQRIEPAEFFNGQVLTTLTGETVVVSIVAGDINLNGATINQVSGGVDASNGIFYVVDDLIIPPGNTEVEEAEDICSLPDIPTILTSATFFKTLITALEATGLIDSLSEPNGAFTIFAPADDSFDMLPDGLLECLLEDDNLPVLAEILQYHVVPGRYITSDFTDGQTIETLLSGEFVDIKTLNGIVHVNNVLIEPITSNFETSNGIIQLIETSILVPPSFNTDAFLASSNCVEVVDPRINDDDGNNTGTWIAIIVGASAGLVLIAAIALLIHRRR